jgi:hypothetical protein
MRNKFVVSIQDLRFVTILCKSCNTQVTLDLHVEPHPNSIPRMCPRCQALFEGVIPGALETMQKIYTALADLGGAITFSRDEPGPEARQTVDKDRKK